MITPTSTPVLDRFGLTEGSNRQLRLVAATVVSVNEDVAVCAISEADGAPTTATMARTDFYPRRTFAPGDTYVAIQVGEGGPLTVRRPEIIAMLLDGLSPEVRDGRVRVMRTARSVGVRSKVAVAVTDPDDTVNPVFACLGKKANRVAEIRKMLCGERLDVIAWHPDREQFIRNALATADVLSVECEEGSAAVTVRVPRHQLAAARGTNDYNTRLVGQLCGAYLTIEAGD